MQETSTTTSRTRGIDLVPDPPVMTDQRRSDILRPGLLALADHSVFYRLPMPETVALATDPCEPAEIVVTVRGVGNQMRWLNTVEILDTIEDHGPRYSTFRWKVRLPETCILITLAGVRIDTVAVAR